MDDPHKYLDRLLQRGSLPPKDGAILFDRPPDFSDDSLALRFTSRHCEDLRFVNKCGRWVRWDENRWVIDESLYVMDQARAIAREASMELLAYLFNEKLAATVASAKTVSAIERLARADRRHASFSETWDSNPWLLNTPDGTVDLLTGVLRAHRRGDYLTKMTGVDPGGDCHDWLEFLDQIFLGDDELIAYVQRMLGYCLTGSNREHALFFLYGTGGNGKGVFLNTVYGILGDYSAIAAVETFTASKFDRHPTELAMLRGARVVIAQETEQNHRWAESRIKALTGGDPITARFMRQDFFTFHPVFKLVIAGNHKPSLRSVDEAVRRRFNIVPFLLNLCEDKRDRDLSSKLKGEWPGILAWMIKGCLDWQQIGLAPPKAVVDATEEYLESEDSIGKFLEERCSTADANAIVLVEDLYKSWSEWCEMNGEYKGSTKRFSQSLQARRFERCKHPSSRKASYRGITLKVRASST